MPNTNTRWYRVLNRVLLSDASAYITHVEYHISAIPNVVSHSYIPTSSFSDGNTVELIVTIIMNGSKATDDAAMIDLATHLQVDHGYTVIVTVVQSDTVYP